MYLTSLRLRRDPGHPAPTDPHEVEDALHAELSTPPPEHHRLRRTGDEIAVICFVSTAAGGDAHAATELVRTRVARVVDRCAGWRLDPHDT